MKVSVAVSQCSLVFVCLLPVQCGIEPPANDETLSQRTHSAEGVDGANAETSLVQNDRPIHPSFSPERTLVPDPVYDKDYCHCTYLNVFANRDRCDSNRANLWIKIQRMACDTIPDLPVSNLKSAYVKFEKSEAHCIELRGTNQVRFYYESRSPVHCITIDPFTFFDTESPFQLREEFPSPLSTADR